MTRSKLVRVVSLLKDTPLNDLVSAITHVHLGDAVVAPSTTRRLLDHFASNLPAGHEQRSCPGRAPARGTDAAGARGVAAGGPGTVERGDRPGAGGDRKVRPRPMSGRILTKLDLRDRVQAVVLAYETGLVEAGDR